MSWRRFQVLLRCLSVNSHTVQRLQSDRFIGQDKNAPRTVTGKKTVDSWFNLTFGGKGSSDPPVG